MMREIKLLKYTYGLAGNCVGGILMPVCGIILETFMPEMGMTGGLLIMMTGIFAVQLWYGLNVSNLVKSAPIHKASYTSIPTVLCMTVCAVTVVISIIIKLARYSNAEPEVRGLVVNQLLMLAVITILLMGYAAIAYRYYVLGFMLFFILYLPLEIYYEVAVQMWNVRFEFVSVPVAVVLNLLAVAAGGALHYGILRLLYRKGLSKFAQDARLRKYM